MWSKLLAIAALLLSCTANAGVQSRSTISPHPSHGHWIDIWTSMPQLTEPANLPPVPYNGSSVVFQNATIRQTIRMPVGAQQIRIRVSNAFGQTDLHVTSVTVALPFNGSAGVSAILPETLKSVTFSGNPSTVIPNAALAVSDPLDFPIEAQTVITVSIYLAEGQTSLTEANAITSHPGSRTTSWLALGNQIGATNLTGPSLNKTDHWYFLSAVEAWSPPKYSAFVIIGDSITDGRGSTTNQNNRWPDLLLNRLQSNPSTSSIAIANQAAGGNRILADGLGPNVLARIDRDVLAHSGVKYVMLFEGVNDIDVASSDPTNQTLIYNRLIAAYEQIITRTHAHQIPIFAATITPFNGAPNSTVQPYTSLLRDETRQKVNDWIRNSGRFDAVADFDRILADPQNPAQLLPAYDSGDWLHPSVAGYQAIADQFPVEIFERFAGGVAGFI